MNNEVIILIAEDDLGHANLLKLNLKRAGITNQILHFPDGQSILDFFFDENSEPNFNPKQSYMLMLDIRMPKIDGIEVLKKIKVTEHLQKLPVIMITTTDDPNEISKCYELGCNNYIVKPIEYHKFAEALTKLGLFLTIVEIPDLLKNHNGHNE